MPGTLVTKLKDDNPSVRRGAALALGALPIQLLQAAPLGKVVSALVTATTMERVVSQRDAETRRNAVQVRGICKIMVQGSEFVWKHWSVLWWGVSSRVGYPLPLLVFLAATLRASWLWLTQLVWQFSGDPRVWTLLVCHWCSTPLFEPRRTTQLTAVATWAPGFARLLWKACCPLLRWCFGSLGSSWCTLVCAFLGRVDHPLLWGWHQQGQGLAPQFLLCSTLVQTGTCSWFTTAWAR